jgi:hypothetical protein
VQFGVASLMVAVKRVIQRVESDDCSRNVQFGVVSPTITSKTYNLVLWVRIAVKICNSVL